MRVPDWYALMLLALAAFRIYRLIAEDVVLDRPRAWILRLGGWKEGQPTPRGYRAKLGEFLTCPWCAGFYVSCVVWLCFSWQPHITLIVSTPFALNALLALTAKNLDKDE